MNFRTDLAIESTQLEKVKDMEGIQTDEKTFNELTLTKITIDTKEASEKIGKPIGQYITVELPSLTDNFKSADQRLQIIAKQIRHLLPPTGTILVVGLGNYNITPDALGPKTAESILATRHITGEIAKSTGLESLRPVAVLAPGVLGQTGIEVSEILFSVANKIKPNALILVDALASKETNRLGTTIQISNNGISPGSGVGNSRPSINKDTMGIPVISIGVPTVVDATTLAANLFEDIDDTLSEDIINRKVTPHGANMMVTPQEIDLLIERASKLLAMSINCALQPLFSIEDIMSLVS